MAKEKLTLGNCIDVDTPDSQIWHFDPVSNVRAFYLTLIVIIFIIIKNFLQLFWHEFQKSRQIRTKPNGLCLDMNNDDNKVFLDNCDMERPQQKWRFKFENTQLIEETYPHL